MEKYFKIAIKNKYTPKKDKEIATTYPVLQKWFKMMVELELDKGLEYSPLSDNPKNRLFRTNIQGPIRVNIPQGSIGGFFDPSIEMMSQLTNR